MLYTPNTKFGCSTTMSYGSDIVVKLPGGTIRKLSFCKKISFYTVPIPWQSRQSFYLLAPDSYSRSTAEKCLPKNTLHSIILRFLSITLSKSSSSQMSSTTGSWLPFSMLLERAIYNIKLWKTGKLVRCKFKDVKSVQNLKLKCPISQI